MHRVFPTLKGHRLVDKSTLKTTLVATELPAVPTETCNTHAVKILDMYCENHDVVGCTCCMALDHRNCGDVHLIPGSIDSLFNQSDARITNRKLQDMKRAMEEIKTTREALIEMLIESKTEAESDIIDFEKELKTFLNSLVKESLKEVEGQFKQMKIKLEEEKRGAEIELDRLKQAEEGLINAEGNNAQQFVSLKIAQKTIVQTEELTCSLRYTNDAKISFAPDSNIRDFLSKCKTLGSVNQNDNTHSQSRRNVYKIKGTRELNIKMQNDTSLCHVYVSCLTKDATLLMADYNNKKRKRAINVSRPVVDQCNLSDKPNSVCSISNYEAAVTLINKTIQFVSLTDQMTPTRQIKLDHDCFGIAFKQKRIYITDNGVSLYIHDMAGNLLRKVSQDNTGNNLFCNSRHIAFSDAGNDTFVTCYTKGIIKLDENEKHAKTFIPSDLAVATGVCTDGRGNLFVCGLSSHNVVQIGQDGNEFGEIVKASNGLKCPASLCFDQRTSTLVVTQLNSDIVKFFELQ